MSDSLSQAKACFTALPMSDWLTGAMVVFTALIALFTYWAASATRATSKAQLLLQLTTEYGTAEMSQAINTLVAWTKDTPEKQAADADRIDPMRRRFSHYFQKVHELQRNGLIKRDIVCSAVSRRQAELYLEIEPLEVLRGSITGATYDQSSFAFFAKLYGLPRNRTSLRDVTPEGLSTAKE